MPPFKGPNRLTPAQRAFHTETQQHMIATARQKHRRDQLVARLIRRLKNIETLEKELGKPSGVVGLGWRKTEAASKGAFK